MTEPTIVPDSRGVVYCATRKPAYVQLAAQSARSLRALAPELAITLFTDQKPLPPGLADAFTRVEKLESPTRIPSPDWANGLIDKIVAIQNSPYERTFFIDADTLVRDDAVLKNLDRLDDVDILITECAEDASRSRRMMARPIYSSGILVYLHTPAVSLLIKKWLKLSLQNLEIVKSGAGAQALGLTSLNNEQARFLALTDQYSLAQILAPDRCPSSLKVETLGEEWNFRGDGKRHPDRSIIIDHQESLRGGSATVESSNQTTLSPQDRMIAAFPTPIFLRTIAGNDKLNQLLASTVREMAASQKSDDAFRSHQGGFYSDATFFQSVRPGVEQLQHHVQTTVVEYIHQLLGANGPKMHVDLGAWVALTRAGDYQAPHVHAGATLSGIYYVEIPDVPEPQGCIDILNPIVSQEMTFLRSYSKTICRICPQPGNLLIFPAYCRHFVHPFTGTGERICVVFNVTVSQVRLGRSSE